MSPIYWFGLSVILIIVELFTFSLVAGSFALSALILAITLAIWGESQISLTIQLIMWLVIAVGTALFWLKRYRQIVSPYSLLRNINTLVGETGLLLSNPSVINTALVRLHSPKMGEIEWLCEIDSDETEPLVIGDRVKVVNADSGVLIVKKN